MRHLSHIFEPPSLGVAVTGAALSGVGIVGVGVGSIAAAHAAFSIGIGAVLIGYGLLVAFGAWLGARRNPFARGLIVAPALLHIATVASLMQSAETPQVVGLGAVLLLLVATVVAAVLPSTRLALARPAAGED
ncbi:hypothetical protein [Tessaracoccus antarcticus]|uniref:Integral membrane protein n=1 Tax=Tessaracoccus antarcticus TaxID=2479848 RepID=A0A3M0GCL0_9ACTN|nr:hypothetical protein [Tessaracoccus antarcticus]RMB58859.1 hypothetical protein EAX62_12110 [Tessaracoccus antarcticus]